MRHVDLGKDRWAKLIEPDDMTHGMKMRVQEFLNGFRDETVHPFVSGMRMDEQLIAEVVHEWSLDLPVPKGNAEVLADVPGDAFDALHDAVEEHAERLDFNRKPSTSSESRTSSQDTTSPDKNPAETP